MSGPGSPPQPNRAHDTRRQVAPPSWFVTESHGHLSAPGTGEEGEPGPPHPDVNRHPQPGFGYVTTTSYRKPFRVEGGLEPQGGFHNRVLMVSTKDRARVASLGLAQRASRGRDLYTGRPK